MLNKASVRFFGNCLKEKEMLFQARFSEFFLIKFIKMDEVTRNPATEPFSV